MSFHHVVVWIDHSQAHVIHFTPEAAESEVIRIHSTHNSTRAKSGTDGAGQGPEVAHYFDEVAAALVDAPEILIVGPGLEKLELMKHLTQHHPAVAGKVISIETVDHPTDGQLLAYARKYFVRADRLL